MRACGWAFVGGGLSSCWYHYTLPAATVNDFFTRELTEGLRPIDGSRNAVVSPADCRLSAFANVADAKKFWIKGKRFTVNELLDNDPLYTQIFAAGPPPVRTIGRVSKV